MEDNVVIIDFSCETAAYQALTALRTQIAYGLYHVQGVAIAQRGPGGNLTLHFGAEDEEESVAPGTAVGGLLGGLIGLLGGPIGTVAGLALGAALGRVLQTQHTGEVSHVLTAVADEAGVSGAALLLAVQELENHAALDELALRLGGQLSRAPRAVIEERLQQEGFL